MLNHYSMMNFTFERLNIWTQPSVNQRIVVGSLTSTAHKPKYGSIRVIMQFGKIELALRIHTYRERSGAAIS